ncbi:MAG: hypothetical protein PF518_14995 [Spirochaetaceae bacterium]|nr:hypothetical protein [Spirochaetaceae bacterium]
MLGVSIESLQEEDKSKHEEAIALSFRKEEYNEEDFKVIAEFIKVVRNYQKIKHLSHKLS